MQGRVYIDNPALGLVITPNLTTGKGGRLPAWGEDGFIDILRDGAKDGRAINPLYMPWTSYRHMTDDELRAVYLYLMSQPPLEFGRRQGCEEE